MHEFVARLPANQIAQAQLLAEALGDVAQQAVAGGMALGFVDPLEAVQVEDNTAAPLFWLSALTSNCSARALNIIRFGSAVSAS